MGGHRRDTPESREVERNLSRARTEQSRRLRVERATQAARVAALGIPAAAETTAVPPSLAEVMSWEA